MPNKLISALVLVIAVILGFYLYKKYKIAPDLELENLQVTDLSGNTVQLDQFVGKKTILCFGASWCGPCRSELKLISAVKDETLTDVEVVVISDEPIGRVQQFRDHTGYPFTWLKLVNSFNEMGIKSIPTTYLVNTKGKIVKKEVGYIDWGDASTVKRLKELMK